MNCSDFRRAVGAQPGLETPELTEHAATCPACARYRDEMRKMDALLIRALRIDVSSFAVRTSMRRFATHWRLAASVALAAVLGALLWIARPEPSLAEQVVAHAEGEAFAIVRTSERAAPADLEAAFAGSGVKLRPDAMHVSYAVSCFFRGHYVPHLVVQTARGPVTVLVLRHESAVPGKPQRFDEDGFSGVILPAPQGALAVLGREASAGKAVAEVLNGLEYPTW
jgi:hypothetical protein